MKFEKKKVQGLVDIEVQFSCDQIEHGYDPFRIVATRKGVHMDGRSPVLSSIDDLQTLAKAIGQASHEYLSLKKCASIVTVENTTQ